MDRLAKKYKKAWKAWGLIGVPIGFIVMVAVLGLLIHNLVQIFLKPAVSSGVAFVLPFKLAGPVIYVPIGYFFISLFVVIIVHEGAHGILSRAYNLKIRSTGLGLFAIFPLAFVEPDEKQLNNSSHKAQLSIFSAGAFSNLCTAAIVLLLTTLVVAPAAANILDYQGIYIDDTIPGFPAEKAGLASGDIIHSINGKPTTTYEEFAAIMDNITPGDEIFIKTQSQDILIKTIENPNNNSLAYMGVKFSQNIGIKSHISEKFGETIPYSLIYLLKLLNWIFILNIGIGAVNLLPLGPIDGGRMLSITLNKYMKNKKKAAKIFKAISIFTLVLLILNIIGPYIAKLFI